MNINKIIKEFNEPNKVDQDVIKAVLTHCSHKTQVGFALHCAKDVMHLNEHKSIKQALTLVQEWLDTGKPTKKQLTDAAHVAANAAYAAANAANAAANAVYAAANAAANAVYAAAAYAAYAAYAATNAANAAYAVASAADAAADAVAYAAYAAAYAPSEHNRVRQEKTREYLLKLKEMVLLELPKEEVCWLLKMVM